MRAAKEIAQTTLLTGMVEVCAVPHKKRRPDVTLGIQAPLLP